MQEHGAYVEIALNCPTGAKEGPSFRAIVMALRFQLLCSLFSIETNVIDLSQWGSRVQMIHENSLSLANNNKAFQRGGTAY